VWRTVNRLIRLGARVVHEKIAPVHVSGHACQEELKLMLSLLKPRYIAPSTVNRAIRRSILSWHGQMGYRDEQMFLLENGSVLRIENGIASLGEPVPAGRYLIEEGTEGVSEEIIRDRRQIAHEACSSHSSPCVPRPATCWTTRSSSHADLNGKTKCRWRWHATPFGMCWAKCCLPS
jgi:mRNA degradation ribonuclease J1/J2